MDARPWMVSVVVVISFGILLAAQDRGVAPRKGGEDLSGPYEPVPNWPQPPVDPALTWGRTNAIFAESPDRVTRNVVVL